MNQLNKQYVPEYNYYCAMLPEKHKPTYSAWLKWRTVNAIQQFN